ncbi:MAG: NADP-dependent malic enzyme [Calditrichales bacterium]|nr:MAG: NADP-dependent malic enzyme [Calditrichales bacterium]
MIERNDALKYHESDRPGKIEVKASKPCVTPREMRLAYLPGAAFPSEEIAKKPDLVFRYTSKGNLVAVVSNGSAVPGLGNVGPLAAKPMLEGIAVLFKRLADIDVFDIELNTEEPDIIVETIQRMEPTFGGINLKDIRAPEGLWIHDRLCKTLHIPVFHENLYSTAVVSMAALMNALELVEKNIQKVQIVVCGAGTIGTGIARLLDALEVPREHIHMYDVKGLIHPDRDDLHDYQRLYANQNAPKSLLDGMRDADVFIGASAGNVIDSEAVRAMNRYPIVFALATPHPEISYEEALASRQDLIFATGLGQYPNAVLDILSFPYILRGALDVQASTITEKMMLAASRALADLAKEEVIEEVERAYGDQHFSFGPDYLLPKPIDPRILIAESSAVAQTAIAEGIALNPMDAETHRGQLNVRIGTGREIMRSLILRARQKPKRIVFSEGGNETILRACHILREENIAIPVILGHKSDIKNKIEQLGLNLSGITILDTINSPLYEPFVDTYFDLRRRRGVTRDVAAYRMRHPDYFASMMVHSGEADMVIAGFSTHYADTLRTILEIIGPAPGINRVSSYYMVLLPKDVIFVSDCVVNIDPTAEELAEIAILTAAQVQKLGFDPRIAMLSFSNFGSVDHPLTIKVRAAVEIAKKRVPEVVIDGEMQIAPARDPVLRKKYFPFSELTANANILVFPDLQSGNLTLQSLQYIGEAIPIGPILMGTRLPAHLLQYGASVEEVVNLCTVASVVATQ